MIRYILNLIGLCGVFTQFIHNSVKQRSFIKRTLAYEIELAKLSNDGSLSDQDINKIFKYYGWAVPSLLGESFCVLRGKKMTEDERHALTYLGALTGLLDDLFDAKKTTDQHIRQLINNPDENLALNSHERLLVRFYQKAMEKVNPEKLRDSAMEVFEVQILSREQQTSGISRERILDITKHKGGASILFYRTVFEPSAEKDETEMLFNMGAVGQMANDLFDIWDDYHDGIKTLATTATSIEEIRQIYIPMMRTTFELINKTIFPSQNKRKFRKFFSLIACRALVCLDFLEGNEIRTNQPFNIEKYQRYQLICDMGNLKNTLRLIHYFARFT